MSLYQLFSPISVADIKGMVDGVHNLDINEIAKIEIITRDGESAYIQRTDRTSYFRIVGISEDSKIYEGLSVRENGALSLGANETYVWANSRHQTSFRP